MSTIRAVAQVPSDANFLPPVRRRWDDRAVNVDESRADEPSADEPSADEPSAGLSADEPSADQVRAGLARHVDADRAAGLAQFFQTQPGGYGEGDVFIGLTVPQVRAVAKQYAHLPLAEIRDLLDDVEHEHRLAALVIAVEAHRRASKTRTQDPALQQRLHALYLDALHAGCVDNWDLVDISAETLVGAHALRFPDAVATREALVADESLWRRRAGIIATFAATKAGDPAPTFAAATAVLDDRRDLVQKATGWMLREVGKRISTDLLVQYLFEHAPEMGRTCLSYATERVDPAIRSQLRALRP